MIAVMTIISPSSSFPPIHKETGYSMFAMHWMLRVSYSSNQIQRGSNTCSTSCLVLHVSADAVWVWAVVSMPALHRARIAQKLVVRPVPVLVIRSLKLTIPMSQALKIQLKILRNERGART
jgi:hypothetical protein